MTQQTTKALMTAMLLVIGIFVFPQSVWADDADDTVIIDGKSYHVLRNSDDWTRLIALVQKAKGGEEVNAIMDDDFTITACVGQEDHPYCGTFDGNGHTLTVDIDGGNAEYMAPFSYGKDCSVKNLHVVGSVSGGIHSSGLIGHSDGTINVDNCQMSAKVTCTSTHLGGFIGHGQKAKNVINNSLFDGALIGGPSIFTNYGGAFIGWESGDTDNEVHNSLENGAYGNIIHVNFCFNAKNGGSAYGLNSDNLTNNWCYQNWSNIGEGLHLHCHPTDRDAI